MQLLSKFKIVLSKLFFGTFKWRYTTTSYVIAWKVEFEVSKGDEEQSLDRHIAYFWSQLKTQLSEI